MTFTTSHKLTKHLCKIVSLMWKYLLSSYPIQSTIIHYNCKLFNKKKCSKGNTRNTRLSRKHNISGPPNFPHHLQRSSKIMLYWLNVSLKRCKNKSWVVGRGPWSRWSRGYSRNPLTLAIPSLIITLEFIVF